MAHKKSPKDKILDRCLSCCFPAARRTSIMAEAEGGSGSGGGRRTVRSPSSWLKSEMPELKEKCRWIIARIGRRAGRRQSADFRYDPLSYAMNFDDGEGGSSGDDSQHRSFTSRLAPSPPATEIACG